MQKTIDMKLSVAYKILLINIFLLGGICFTTKAQTKGELIPYGDMDNWLSREIKESFVIGGKIKHLYEIAPKGTIKGDIPYKNMNNSPWATSNVMAKVAGITKTNTSVFPDRRGEGFCARLDTRIESVKVLGLVNITVLAAGSIFTGSVNEPITETKNPQKILQAGIPFTKKPKKLVFDYKVKLSENNSRIKLTGFGRKSVVEGKDFPAVTLVLEKRWEDEEGNVYSKTVGVLSSFFKNNTDWVDDADFDIIYNKEEAEKSITKERKETIDVVNYTINKKGKSVPIKNMGWCEEDEQPTHLYLSFSSSHGGAYIGSPGNSFWVDNVRFIY